MTGGLHSCAEFFLPVYLNSLADTDISYKLLNDVLDMLFDNVLGHVEPKKSILIWTILKVCITLPFNVALLSNVNKF